MKFVTILHYGLTKIRFFFCDVFCCFDLKSFQDSPNLWKLQEMILPLCDRIIRRCGTTPWWEALNVKWEQNLSDIYISLVKHWFLDLWIHQAPICGYWWWMKVILNYGRSVVETILQHAWQGVGKELSITLEDTPLSLLPKWDAKGLPKLRH